MNDASNNDVEKWTGRRLTVPTPKGASKKIVVPGTIMIAKWIQGVESKRLLHVLFDSGGLHTLIHKRALPKGAHPTAGGQLILKTASGVLKTNQEVILKDIMLPEFDRTKRIDQQKASVFDQPCQYDIILGRDFLLRAGINIFFSKSTVQWLDRVMDMHEPGFWSKPGALQFFCSEDSLKEWTNRSHICHNKEGWTRKMD